MIDKFKLPIALSILGLVLIIGGIFSSGLNNQKPKEFPKESLSGGQDMQAQKMISVDISGAVLNPGVFKLEEGSRIEDIVNKAGGFSEKANSEYISKNLNLAQKLADGTKVYVPFEGESTSPSGGGYADQGQVAGTSTIGSKVNINNSSQSELETLSGVGPVTASKIISGRPYGSVNDLIGKKIVRKALFEKIKDSIVIY